MTTDALEFAVKAIDQATPVLKGIGKTIDNMSNVGKKAAGGLSKSFGDVKNQFMQTYGPAVTLAAGVAGIGTAVAAASNFIKSSIGDWVDYNETVRKLSITTGVGTVELSRMLQAADDLGIGMEAMEKALVFASKNGVQPTLSNVMRLSDELRSMTDVTQRNEQMTKIFGKAFAETSAFFLQGSEAIRKGTEAIADNLIVTSQSMAEARAYAVAVDEMTDAWQGFKNEVGSAIIPPLTQYMRDFSGATQRSFDEVADSLIASGATWDELTIAMRSAADAAKLNYTANKDLVQIHSFAYNYKTITRAEYELAQARRENTERMRENVDWLLLTNGAYAGNSAVLEEAADQTNALGEAYDVSLIPAMQYYASQAPTVAKATQSIATTAKTAGTNIAYMFDQLNVGIAETIAGALDQLEFKLAGGEALVAAFDKAKADIMARKITPQEGQAWLSELYVAAVGLKVKLGELSFSEAATNIRENLKVPIEEAYVLLQQFVSKDGSEFNYQAYFDVTYRTHGQIPPGLGGGGGGNKGLTGSGNILLRDSGGPVERGQPYMIGLNRKPELFVPNQSGTVITLDQLTKALKSTGGRRQGGPTYSLTINNAQSSRSDYERTFRILMALAR